MGFERRQRERSTARGRPRTRHCGKGGRLRPGPSRSEDTAGARREYARAEALYDRDPYLHGSHAYYLMTLGDTTDAAPRIARARTALEREPMALRAHVLLLLARGDVSGANSLADSAIAWFPGETAFYRARNP